MSMLFDQQNQYNPGYSQQPQPSYYPQQQPSGLDFYGGDAYGGYGRPSLEGNVAAGGTGGASPSGFGGNMQQTGWLAALGTGGFEGEPPLLEGTYPSLL
jgi:protein YIPF5/7